MLANVVRATAAATLAERGLDAGILPERITLRRPRDPEHGDFATAIAMQVAPGAGLAPGEFAQALSDGLVATGLIASATVAEPGFVNLRLSVAVQAEVVRTVLREGPAFGALDGTVVADGVRARAADGRVMDVSDLAALVGDDVARYELARHPVGATVDVDVDVLRGRTEANPAFAVRYAHARLAAVVRNAAELGLSLPSPDALDLAELRHSREIELTRALAEYPGLVARAAEAGEGYRIPRYLEELAEACHRFAAEARVLPQGDEEATAATVARIALCAAARQVFANGLALLGVQAAERI